MSLNYPSTGLGYMGAYQVSTIPFVTSSVVVPALGTAPLEINFPYVTKNIVVRNTGAFVIRAGFSSAGVTGSLSNNYFLLGADESFESEFRVSKVFVVSNVVAASSYVSIIAGMTAIPATELITNWSGTLGVG